MKAESQVVVRILIILQFQGQDRHFVLCSCFCTLLFADPQICTLDHNGTDKIYRLPKVEDNSWNRPALTEEQVEMLYQCKGLKPKEEEVRDLFVLNCNIGQRFSDFISKVNRDTIHVNENGIEVVELIQDKRNHKVIVPITPQAKELLMKYDYKLPKYTPTQANYYLGKIAEKAGLTNMVQILSEEHSDYKPEMVPLYSLIIGKRMILTNYHFVEFRIIFATMDKVNISFFKIS